MPSAKPGTAGGAGLGARHANLHDAPLGEQRKIVRRGANVVPVRAPLEKVRLAFREPRGPCTGANGVRRFGGEQGLISGNEIGGQELLLEVRRQAV